VERDQILPCRSQVGHLVDVGVATKAGRKNKLSKIQRRGLIV
jgi:hypothetical protein